MHIPVVSFDQCERANASVTRPAHYRELPRIVGGSSPAIARGQGLNYCLASAADGAVSVSMSSFARILAFAPESRTIEVEAGLPLGELLAFLIPRGFWFPVLPGYPSITVGGSLAMNVHGKSQHHGGLFGDHVQSLTLLHPARGELRCSREENQDLFAVTLGGFGLTGIVTRVRLSLAPLAGHAIERRRVAVRSINEAVERLRADCGAGASVSQVYSWNDLNRRGAAFGSGFVYVERHVPAAATTPRQRPARLNSTFARAPWRALARLGVHRWMNHAYRLRESVLPATRRLDLMAGSFPLHGNEIYFQLAGARGFHESQVIVPFASWPRYAEGLERLLSDHGVVTTLGSLKIFRGERTLLNFRQDGVCVALDIPTQKGDLQFLDALDHLMLDCGGIPNISKDSRVRAEVARAAYGDGYAEFKSRLAAIDPGAHMQSALRKRIDV